MPIALVLGILAGINEGRVLDRFISVTSLGATATPEFVTGIFLILIFGIWLRWVPAVAIFTSPNAIFENPSLLVLPVLTLTAVEVGYVARATVDDWDRYASNCVAEVDEIRAAQDPEERWRRRERLHRWQDMYVHYRRAFQRWAMYVLCPIEE